MNYDVVVGLEIHAELNTETKMFSGAPYHFKAEANTCTNEIDLAHPGTLPCVNHTAVKKAVELCTALKLSIDPLIRFDRKNYYYSDLPKGYQITQQFHPIGKNGYLTIDIDGIKKDIRINRIHMEEDTAKQFHLYDETLIDFNRAGVPLVEIVSEPDMQSGLEAALYVEKLKQTLNYLDVSKARMEEGSMRCDVNISLKPEGSKVYGTKVEIKNLNSIANIKDAIEYEIERQTQILNDGGKIEQETRRFDEKTMTTVTMRKKEGNVDYKFFPEPNIFPIRLKDEEIAEIQASMPELPDQKEKKYIEDFHLSAYDAKQLLLNKELAFYFDAMMSYSKNAKLCCNYLVSELQGLLVKNGETIETTKVKPRSLSRLVDLVSEGSISSKQAKEVLEIMLSGEDPDKIVNEKGMKQVSDTSAIEKLVDEVLDENPNSIIDYKNGKDRALGFLVGQVMKKSKGQANPKMTSDMVKEKLAKR